MSRTDVPVKILMTVTYLAMVTMNYLANALPLNGRETGAISDAYANLFAPAGLTFAIWGVIYLLLAFHILYQWGAFRQQDAAREPLLRRVAILFSLSSVANTAWVFAWHYDVIWLSALLIVTILALLAVIVVTLQRAGLTGRDHWFVGVPFSVYFGWLTVATVANATVWLVSIGWDGLGISEEFWAVIIIAVAAVIGTLIMLHHRDIAYGLVLLWAFAGILIKHTSDTGFASQYPQVITTTIICLVAFLAAEGFIIWRKQNHA
jgi:hypothetical protein